MLCAALNLLTSTARSLVAAMLACCAHVSSTFEGVMHINQHVLIKPPFYSVRALLSLGSGTFMAVTEAFPATYLQLDRRQQLDQTNL